MKTNKTSAELGQMLSDFLKSVRKKPQAETIKKACGKELVGALEAQKALDAQCRPIVNNLSLAPALKNDVRIKKVVATKKFFPPEEVEKMRSMNVNEMRAYQKKLVAEGKYTLEDPKLSDNKGHS